MGMLIKRKLALFFIYHPFSAEWNAEITSESGSAIWVMNWKTLLRK